LTLIGFLMPLLLGLTFGNSEGWTSPRVVSLLVASVIVFIAFAFVEKRAAEPIIPPKLLAIADIQLAVTVLAILAVPMFDAILFAPLFMQTVLDASATLAGVIFGSMSLMMSISSASSGQLISRTGRYKIIAIFGILCVISAMYFLSQLSSTTSSLMLVVLLVLNGLGLGLAMPVFTLTIQNASPHNMIGAATALSQFCRSIGATIGAAVLGAILQARYWETLKSSIASSAVPEHVSNTISNPARMKEIKAVIAATYGTTESGKAAALALMDQIKNALIIALHEVFWLGAAAAVLALVITFFVTERKLRSQ
jgi:MFS family permease